MNGRVLWLRAENKDIVDTTIPRMSGRGELRRLKLAWFFIFPSLRPDLVNSPAPRPFNIDELGSCSYQDFYQIYPICWDFVT